MAAIKNPLLPLVKYVFKLVLYFVKNSTVLQQQIEELIGKCIKPIQDFIVNEKLDQIPGFPAIVGSLKIAITNLEAPTIPPISVFIYDPNALKAIQEIPAPKKQEILNKIIPLENNLTNIIVQKNKIVTEVNKLRQTITKLKDQINTLSTPLEATQIAIDVVSNLPLPTAPIPIPTNVLLGFQKVLDIAQNRVLTPAQSTIDFIQSTLTTLLNIINPIVGLLNIVDAILAPIINLLGLIKTLLTLSLTSDITTTLPANLETATNATISNLISSFSFTTSSFDVLPPISSNIQQSASLAADTILLNSLQPNSNNPYFYKNFQFILENQPNNPYSFASRRVKALQSGSINGTTLYNDPIILGVNTGSIPGTVNGTVVGGRYSYSATTQILVEEAQYQVDEFLRPSNLLQGQNAFEGSPTGSSPSEGGGGNTILSGELSNIYPDFLPVNYYLIGGPTSTTVLGKTDPKSYKGPIPILPQNTAAVDYSLLLSKNRKAVAKMEFVPSSSIGAPPKDSYRFVIYTGSFDEKGEFINQPSPYSLFVQATSTTGLNKDWSQLVDSQAFIKLDFVQTDFSDIVGKGTVRFIAGKMGSSENDSLLISNVPGPSPANDYKVGLVNIPYRIRLFLNDYGKLSIQELQTTGSNSNWKDIYLIN